MYKHTLERNKKYSVTVLCEPYMTKRKLYPTLSTKETSKKISLMIILHT